MTQPKLLPLPFNPNEFPGVRIGEAIAAGTDKSLCFVVGGGLGDRACAEPTLRFALRHFDGVKISLLCETPEIFRHLKFENVYDLKTNFPISGRHLFLYTYANGQLSNQFLNANLLHPVDYASIMALRVQLPKHCRTIEIHPIISSERNDLTEVCSQSHVLIHPGRTWPSRTLPAEWWNGIIRSLTKAGLTTVIIGSDTVEVESDVNCIDLRGQTNLTEFMWLCKNCKSIITNDSSPIHFASSGEAKIAYVATSKRGDLLLHERHGGFGWRMREFSQNNMWSKYNLIPNTLNADPIVEVPPGFKIDYFLPDQTAVVDWIRSSE